MPSDMPLGETGDEGVEAIKSGLDTFEPGLEVIDDLVQDGFVNLTEHDWESTIFDHTGADSVGEKPGSGGEYASGVVPGGESVGHFGAVIARGELVSPGPEVRRDRTEHRQEPLRCAR